MIGQDNKIETSLIEVKFSIEEVFRLKFINESLEGYRGMKIPYTLYGKSDNSQDLLILLPGTGYTVNSPVFHYSTEIFFNQYLDILEVNYPYKNEFYKDFSFEELNKAVKIDSALIIDTVLNTNSYKNFYFIGKSLGTIAMSSLLDRNEFKDAKVIWLTPILSLDEVLNTMVESKNKGLCFIGDNDRFYTKELFNELRRNENITSKLIPGANHSLDFNEDPIKSIDILKWIVTDINNFLSTHLSNDL
jgi:hypothetical protein